MASVYNINKGINKPVEFRGLKAQYIWYLGGGLVVLMILFAVMYIAGVHIIICLIVIGGLGSFLTYKVYHMSRIYGEHGLMKLMAQKRIPKAVKANSRKMFQFKKVTHENITTTHC